MGEGTLRIMWMKTGIELSVTYAEVVNERESVTLCNHGLETHRNTITGPHLSYLIDGRCQKL